MSLPSLFGDGELPEELTVAELNRQAKSAVEGAFGNSVFVRGELVEFKIWRSGHWYFTLRDADASIRCMLWKQQAAGVLKRQGQAPTDGMEVLSAAGPRSGKEKGEYRLTATDIIPTALLGSEGARAGTGPRRAQGRRAPRSGPEAPPPYSPAGSPS